MRVGVSRHGAEDTGADERRRGGCPTARDVRPNEGLGDGAPSWALPLLRRHPGEFPEVTPHERSMHKTAPRGIPRGYSSRAHSTCAFWSVHSARVVAIAITGGAALVATAVLPGAARLCAAPWRAANNGAQLKRPSPR